MILDELLADLHFDPNFGTDDHDNAGTTRNVAMERATLALQKEHHLESNSPLSGKNIRLFALAADSFFCEMLRGIMDYQAVARGEPPPADNPIACQLYEARQEFRTRLEEIETRIKQEDSPVEAGV